VLRYGANVETALLLVCPPEITKRVWPPSITGREAAGHWPAVPGADVHAVGRGERANNPGHYLGGNVPPPLRNLNAPGLGGAMLLNGLLVAGVMLALIGWARGNWRWLRSAWALCRRGAPSRPSGEYGPV